MQHSDVGLEHFNVGEPGGGGESELESELLVNFEWLLSGPEIHLTGTLNETGGSLS